MAYAYDDVPGQPLSAGQLVSLPVELTDFNARAQNDHISLNWRTETEVENAGFHLQRATKNFEWEDILWLKGQGTSLLPKQYAYNDREVQQSVVYYYRLKQVDLDGRETFSDIVSATFYNDRFTVSPLMPNPVAQGSSAFIEIKNPVNEEAQITILNAEGRLMGEQTVELQSYAARLEIQTAHLAPGLYFVKIATPNHAEYQKLVVQ